MNINIFPVPRKISCQPTRLNLGQAEWIVLPQPCSRKLRERIQDIAGRLGRMLNRTLRVAAAPPQEGGVMLELRRSAKLADQAFELKLGKAERHLHAGGEAGAFYGMQAFAQLVEQFGETPPELSIQDAPDFPARGVMLDVSRCKVPTMDTCRQLVDRLAAVRINQLQLYTEHTFAFSAHPAVWHDASPFTHEEILGLDRYCADRFVELVPNLNSFGHFGRWLRHPEYRHLGECPENPGTDCLAPNRASLKFIEALYDEYLPHFASPMFNVGCDETWELGKGRSKAKAEKTSTTAVYLDFLKEIHRLVAKKGRRMQFWGDIILHQPELIKELPQDILALCWGYEANHPYAQQCQAFAEAGIEYHVCPGTSAWNSISGRTGNCLENLENAARNGHKYGATGFLNTDWGDGGHHQVLPVSYAGFAAGAAYSWHLDSNRDADLAGAVSRHFFDDPTGTLGQLCLDLGRTPDYISGLKRGNCSALNQLLFTKPDRLDLANVSRTQLNRAESWLGKLSANLSAARPAGSDRELALAELRHALAMSLHAVHRGRFLRFGDESRETLRRELRSLVMSHEDQWLARNRRGGLHESSTRLRGTALAE